MNMALFNFITDYFTRGELFLLVLILMLALRQYRFELYCHAQFKALREEMDHLRAHMDKQFSIVFEAIAALQAEIAIIKADIVNMKVDIANMKADIVNMKADIVNIKADIVNMKADIADIRSELRDLRKDMQHGFQINDLKHESYEEKIKKLEAERPDSLKSKQA